MMSPEDLLQESLEKLEEGESLEACLAGLADEEAVCIRMAIGLGEAVASFLSPVLLLQGPARTAEGGASVVRSLRHWGLRASGSTWPSRGKGR